MAPRRLRLVEAKSGVFLECPAKAARIEGACARSLRGAMFLPMFARLPMYPFVPDKGSGFSKRPASHNRERAKRVQT
jgi:hypothetical protein